MAQKPAHPHGPSRTPLLLSAVCMISMQMLCQEGLTQSGAETQVAARRASFDAVSIRQNKSGKGFELNYSPDGFTATNMTLQPVIMNAYKLRDPDLMIDGKSLPGAPNWINSDRYDIRAKISPSDMADLQTLSREQQIDQTRLMLQSMLADRFNLKVRHESKQASCYALSVEKKGSKMKEAKSADPAFPDGKMLAQPGSISAQGSPMSRLVFALMGPLRCAVQDRTNLTGKYDFTLQYSPDSGPSSMLARPEISEQPVAAPPVDASGPSLFTAVREQLGLQLIPITEPVESLFIEHIERPTEN